MEFTSGIPEIWRILTIHENPTNNRGELRVALVALQKKTQGKQTFICLDSLLVVDGALRKAQTLLFGLISICMVCRLVEDNEDEEAGED